MALGRKDTLSFEAVREITDGADWQSFVEKSIEEHFEESERISINELPRGVDAKILFRPSTKARNAVKKYLKNLTSEDLHKPELCADVFEHAFEKAVEEILDSDSERHYEITGEASGHTRGSTAMNSFIRSMQRRDILSIQSYLENISPFAQVTHIVRPRLKQHRHYQRPETQTYGLGGGMQQGQSEHILKEEEDPRQAAQKVSGKTDPWGIFPRRTRKKPVKGRTLVGGLTADEPAHVEIPPASRVPQAPISRKRTDTLRDIFMPAADTSRYLFTPERSAEGREKKQEYVHVSQAALIKHLNNHFSAAKAQEEAATRDSLTIAPPPGEGIQIEELTEFEKKVYHLGFEDEFYRLFRGHFRGHLRNKQGNFTDALRALSTGLLPYTETAVTSGDGITPSKLFMKLAKHAMGKKIREHERSLEAAIKSYLDIHTDTRKVKELRQTSEDMDPAAGMSAEDIYFTLRELFMSGEEMNDQMLWTSYFFLEGNEEKGRSFYRNLYNLVHAHFTYTKHVPTLAPPAPELSIEEEIFDEVTQVMNQVETSEQPSEGEALPSESASIEDDAEDAVTRVRNAGIFDVPPSSQPAAEEETASSSPVSSENNEDRNSSEMHSFRPNMLPDVVAFSKENGHFTDKATQLKAADEPVDTQGDRPTVPEGQKPVTHKAPVSRVPLTAEPKEKIILNLPKKDLSSSHRTIRPHEEQRPPEVPRAPAPRPAAGTKPEVDMSRSEMTEVKRYPESQNDIPTLRPPKPKPSRWRRWVAIGAAAVTAFSAYFITRKGETVDEQPINTVQTATPPNPTAPKTTPKETPIDPPKTVDKPIDPPKKPDTPVHEFDNSRVPERNVYLRNLIDKKGFDLEGNKGGVNRQFLTHAVQAFDAEQRADLKKLNQKLDRGVYAVAMKKFGNLKPYEVDAIAHDPAHPDHGFLVSTLAMSKQLNQPFTPKVKVMEKNADGTAVTGTDGKPVFKVLDYWEAYADEFKYGQQYMEEMAAKGYANIHNIGKPGEFFNIEGVTYYRDVLDIAGAVKVASHDKNPNPAVPGGPVQSPAPKNPRPLPQNDPNKHGFFQIPTFDHPNMTPQRRDKIEIQPDRFDHHPDSKYAKVQPQSIDIPVYVDEDGEEVMQVTDDMFLPDEPATYAANRMPMNKAGRAFTRTTDKSERLVHPGSSKNVNMSFLKKKSDVKPPAVTPDRFAHVKAGAEAYRNNALKIGGVVLPNTSTARFVEDQIVASRLRPDVEKFVVSGLKYYQKLGKPLYHNLRKNQDGTYSKDVHPGLISYLTRLMDQKMNPQPSPLERANAARAQKAAEEDAKFMAEADVLGEKDLIEVNSVPKTWHIPRAEAMRPIDYIEKSLMDELTRQAVNATHDRARVASLVAKKQNVRAICAAMRNAYTKKFFPSPKSFVEFPLPERWHSKLADVLGADWGAPMKDDMVAQAPVVRKKPTMLPPRRVESIQFLDDTDVIEIDEEAPISGVRQRVSTFTTEALKDIVA